MSLQRKKGEVLNVYFHRLSEEYQIKGRYQEVDFSSVVGVLNAIGKSSPDIVDTVWCLLNNELPSLFSGAEEYKFNEGASTAQIAHYVGILRRGGSKLDREGRDYWIKPLRELGAIEALTFDRSKGFIPGHIKAKSPNSCYRLSSSFVDLLASFGKDNFDQKFTAWISDDGIRKRLELQAEVENILKATLEESPHKALIQSSIDLYAKHFLQNYIVVYKDDSDGDRISEEESQLLNYHGIKLELEDAFPDVILYNSSCNSLWFIEAVTSDGEVDEHKMKALLHICKKSAKEFGGATTTYNTFKNYGIRQQAFKNLADGSRVWILEDPQKELIVEYYSDKK